MIGWDVGRVTTSASADAVEVGEEGAGSQGARWDALKRTPTFRSGR